MARSVSLNRYDFFTWKWFDFMIRNIFVELMIRTIVIENINFLIISINFRDYFDNFHNENVMIIYLEGSSNDILRKRWNCIPFSMSRLVNLTTWSTKLCSKTSLGLNFFQVATSINPFMCHNYKKGFVQNRER